MGCPAAEGTLRGGFVSRCTCLAAGMGPGCWLCTVGRDVQAGPLFLSPEPCLNLSEAKMMNESKKWPNRVLSDMSVSV